MLTNLLLTNRRNRVPASRLHTGMTVRHHFHTYPVTAVVRSGATVKVATGGTFLTFHRSDYVTVLGG